MVKALIIGATGQQGGATARALLGAGHEVHALTRDPTSAAARALAAQGATLFKGHTSDRTSLQAAAAGTSAVFFASLPSLEDMGEEVIGARNIVAAAIAERSTVRHLVYSTTYATDRVCAGGLELWDRNAFMKMYWENKIKGEEAVRAAAASTPPSGNDGVDDAPKLTYTILRPVEFMSNFVPPLASYQFPDMTSATGTWESAFPADFANLYVDPRDVGRVAAAAIVDPARWAGREVDVVGNRVAVGEVVEMVGRAAGRALRLHSLSRDEALRRGEHENLLLIGQLLRMDIAARDPGYAERPLEDFGLAPPFRTLSEFLEDRKEVVAEAYRNVE